jgi:putative CocE/NonD family hydrolase
VARSPRIVCLDTTVVTPDGVPLATDVTVADDGERHPVLLFRTPYGRASVRGAHDAIGLARLGWAVVTQDVRGRWDSGGAFLPFRSERADGAHTIAWCASQPWSNGAVVMAGASYNGFTQWLALADRPTPLRAIAPAVSGPSVRDAVYEGGALQYGVFTAWTLGIGALGSASLDRAVVAAALAELDGWPRSLSEGIEKSTLPQISPDWTRWLDPEDEALWSSLDATPAVSGLDIAGYHLAGWHDLFCESTLRGYQLLTGESADERTRRRQRLVVGPWSHASMLRRSTGDLDFGVAAQGEFNGLLEEQVAFLTGAVAGHDVPSGVRVFVMGTNRWLDLAAWPPPSDPTPLFLTHEDGQRRLRWSPAQTEGTDRYRHDPTNPVPTIGGRTLHPTPPQAGPLDQRVLDSRPDVVIYTSDPLERDLTIIGTVEAHVVLSSTAEQTDVTVKLVDVHPDGAAMLVVDSIRRVQTTPGRPQQVDLTVGSTALTFRAGHRIRVEIASSNYPRFDTCEAAEQTIHHGGRAASRIVLPVVGATVMAS